MSFLNIHSSSKCWHEDTEAKRMSIQWMWITWTNATKEVNSYSIVFGFFRATLEMYFLHKCIHKFIAILTAVIITFQDPNTIGSKLLSLDAYNQN